MDMPPDSSHPSRRSARIDKNIPIRVTTESRDGQRVDQEALADQVSSHGLRMTISADLATGTKVKVHNPATELSASFRVVWAVPGSGGSYQLGLELAEGDSTLWGMDFSDPSETR